MRALGRGQRIACEGEEVLAGHLDTRRERLSSSRGQAKLSLGCWSQLGPGGWGKVRLRFELFREAQRISGPQMQCPTGQNVLLPWLGLVLGSWLLWAQDD